MWERLSDEAWWRFVILRAARDFVADLPGLLLLMAAAWLILRSIVAVIVLKKSYRPRAVPHLVPFDRAASPPPHDAAPFFAASIQELESLGFAVVCHASIADEAANATVLLVLLANRESQDQAVIISVDPLAKSVVSRRVLPPTRYISFNCRFCDGREWLTTNSPDPVRFPSVPMCRFVQFPDIESPALLYRLHGRAVEEFGDSAKVPLAPSERLLDVMRQDWVTELNWYRGCGYLFISPGDEYHRLTWKGAIVLTCKELWPVRSIRRALVHRRARRLLSEWESHDPAA